MADKKLSGAPNPTLSSSWQNGRVALPKPGHYPSHHKGSLGSSTSSMTSSSTPPLKTSRTLGGLVRPGPHPGQDCSFTRPRGQSLSSALSSSMRTTSSRSKVPPIKSDAQCQLLIGCMLLKCMLGVVLVHRFLFRQQVFSNQSVLLL